MGVPKSEQLEGLNFEVLLTPEEAARGCVVPVGVPVFNSCPQCGGSGHDWVFPCAYCQQQGMIENEELLRIRIPPMAPPGSIYEIPLRGLGIKNFCLESQMDLNHLRREARTALELAIVALAPSELVDRLAAAAGLLEALVELPTDSAPVVAIVPKLVTRARSALDDWQKWQQQHLDKRILRG